MKKKTVRLRLFELQTLLTGTSSSSTLAVSNLCRLVKQILPFLDFNENKDWHCTWQHNSLMGNRSGTNNFWPDFH